MKPFKEFNLSTSFIKFTNTVERIHYIWHSLQCDSYEMTHPMRGLYTAKWLKMLKMWGLESIKLEGEVNKMPKLVLKSNKMFGRTPIPALVRVVQRWNQVTTKSLLYHIEQKSLQFWYKYLVPTNTPIHTENQYGSSTSWKRTYKGADYHDI